MKLKLVLFFMLITSAVFSQSVDAVIDAKIEAQVNRLVDAKLAAFAKTLDSAIFKTVTATGTTFIDTIRQGNSQNCTYLLTLNGETVSGTKITAIRAVNINTTNGIYSVPFQTAIKGFTGTSGSFDISIVNNICSVKITLASSTNTVKWTYKRTNI